MEIQKLLGNHTCTCGRNHSCGMRAVHIGAGALEALGEETRKYRRILLAADQNTYPVCGERVKELLGDSLEDLLMYTGEGYLAPDEAAIEAMERKLTPQTDLILGIGSGVIQDLCKYVSFHAKLPYQIIATAPSMDGYASSGAAMILGRRKVTVSAQVPEVLIGDTRILKEAPLEMLQAGYGDILGKYSCLNDWQLSRVVHGEYFCPRVCRLTYDMLLEVRALGPKLGKRDPRAVQTLMEALVGVGIAMSYVGNSRPASGSEHHLAHFFEVVGLLKQESYFAHGIDVAYGAYLTQKMREELLRLSAWPQTAENRESRFAGRSSAEEHQFSRELAGYLNGVGLSEAAFEDMYGREKIGDAVRFAKELKDRYTVLWLYNAYLDGRKG